MSEDRDKEKIINKIIERLVQSLKPEKIILFGSCAGGRETSESDIDILAVTDERLSIQERYFLNHKLFDDLSREVQLILITPANYEETKDVIGGIAYPESNYGRILYALSTIVRTRNRNEKSDTGFYIYCNRLEFWIPTDHYVGKLRKRFQHPV